MHTHTYIMPIVSVNNVELLVSIITTNAALSSEITMKMTTIILGTISQSPSSQFFSPSSTGSIVVSSTAEPSISQPYLFIAIGALGGIVILFVIGLLICCCCVLYIRRQR